MSGSGNLGGLSQLDSEWTVSLGGVDWGILGHKGFFLAGSSYDVGIAAFFLFQMVFMDTAATIPTGALAERWKWTGFVIYSLFIGAVIYPVFANWAWGGGWLSQLGSHDPSLGRWLHRLRGERRRPRRRRIHRPRRRDRPRAEDREIQQGRLGERHTRP